MRQIKKILAPTDLSEVSKLGVSYALDLARDVGAEVIVYHAITIEEEVKAIRANLIHIYDLVGDKCRLLNEFIGANFGDRMNLVELRQVVEMGAPFQNIVDIADKENVDLIVIATHGRTGVDHMMMGSVAEKVVARAACPVLVIPRRRRSELAAKAAA